MSETKQENELGRNEPCPCRSGKKYKRCCGVAAAPKLFESKQGPSPAGMDPSLLEGVDPQMLMQMTQAVQRLPKGQLQRMQSLMQKAMSGKDVTAEAQAFERSLPLEFQEMVRSMGQSTPPSEVDSPIMTEEVARELIAKAALEGAIPASEADALLGTKNSAAEEVVLTPQSAENSQSESHSKSRFSRFWKSFSAKQGA